MEDGVNGRVDILLIKYWYLTDPCIIITHSLDFCGWDLADSDGYLDGDLQMDRKKKKKKKSYDLALVLTHSPPLQALPRLPVCPPPTSNLQRAQGTGRLRMA